MNRISPKFTSPEITDPEILDGIPADLRRYLLQGNGAILFDGGLHIRGAVISPEWHSLRHVWLGDFALHKLFPALDEADIPFAQDCLGDQYLIREGVVHRLEAESGDLENLAVDFDGFLSQATRDPVEYLTLQPLLQFHSEGGELNPGQLLSAYPPFITKESGQGVRLRAISMFDRIGFLADFARQIAGVADGEKVRLTVVNTSGPEN
jgi:hypothetical protein